MTLDTEDKIYIEEVVGSRVGAAVEQFQHYTEAMAETLEFKIEESVQRAMRPFVERLENHDQRITALKIRTA